ncbi:hypothetical protein OC846_004932 [Tilletia horrida]|uniref:Uncharacterized protein n=1 Tax=Tilletia horrida TaxID=155126 RepID=A0AAN6GPI4_9BASI|nr:hypothetical protein OC846_004932 [Tilletia horrida]KAK0547329.1 hypothetical protein OC845_004150 [Tilletia horrida]KAK0564602.1 hypothetical protein OC861_004192 [Tilletia horrida]
MRTTAILSGLAALLATSSAAPLDARGPLNAITCTGQTITGTLVVRNPDQSTHVASFVKGDTDTHGRLKLTTKYQGVPAPTSQRWKFSVCNSAEYIYGGRKRDEEPESTEYTGFLSPYNHPNKALAVGDNYRHDASDGTEYDLVSDDKADSRFTYQSLTEFFSLYHNTSDTGDFYTLAYGGREGGLTAGFGYSPISVRSGNSIFVRMKSVETGELALFANYYGYALELHP